MKKYIKPEAAVYETKLIGTILNTSFEVNDNKDEGADGEDSFVREELTWESVW